MKQTTTIPETTMDRVLDLIHLNITDPNAVISIAEIYLQDPNAVPPPPAVKTFLKSVPVNVNTLCADEIALGNITAANVNGFKKVIKAICAKSLDLAFTDISDPIV
jgi:hypothetical protein